MQIIGVSSILLSNIDIKKHFSVFLFSTIHQISNVISSVPHMLLLLNFEHILKYELINNCLSIRTTYLGVVCVGAIKLNLKKSITSEVLIRTCLLSQKTVTRYTQLVCPNLERKLTVSFKISRFKYLD